MKKLIALGAVIALMLLTMAAAAMPVGQDEVQNAFPGERSIEVQGAQVTVDGTLQEPGITTSGNGITVKGADSTLGGTLREP